MMYVRKHKRLFLSICFLVAIYLGIALSLDFYGQHMPSQKSYDAIVVLGCKVKDSGVPSLALQRRTDLAISLWKEGYAPKIIFTGGKTRDVPTEAQAAMDYAVAKYQLPKSTFLKEEISTSTEENAKYTKELYPDNKSILIVSDSYHVWRGEKVFEKYFEQVDGVGRTPKWDVRAYGAIREIPAIVKYKILGAI